MLLGEMSWQVQPHRPWQVGRSSGTGSWAYNSKNVLYAIKERGQRDPLDPPALDLEPQNDTSLGSDHPGGLNVAMADGSIHFIQDETTIEVLRLMANRKDRTAYDSPF